MKTWPIFSSGRRRDAVARNDLDQRKNFAASIDSTGRRVGFRRGVERAQRNRHRFIFVQFLKFFRSPVVFVIKNAAHRRRTGAGRGVIGHFELRAHRIVKIKPRLRFRIRIVSGEDRHHHADALHHETKIIAQQFGKRAHFSVHAHFLQLRPSKILKRMFEHTRHFPRRRRHARDRHDRVAIDFQNFVGAIVDHGVAGGRAPIARHQHAAAKI